MKIITEGVVGGLTLEKDSSAEVAGPFIQGVVSSFSFEPQIVTGSSVDLQLTFTLDYRLVQESVFVVVLPKSTASSLPIAFSSSSPLSEGGFAVFGRSFSILIFSLLCVLCLLLSHSCVWFNHRNSGGRCDQL